MNGESRARAVLRRRHGLIAATMVIVVSSCGTERDIGKGADDATRESAPIDSSKGEQLSMQSYTTPDQFPLQFSTLLPAGTVTKTEVDTVGNLVAVQFTADPGVTLSTDAYVHVYVYAPGTIAHNARNAVQAFLLSRGTPGAAQEERPPESPGMVVPPQPWALLQEDYEFQGQDGRWRQGTVLLGQHGDRFFHVNVNALASDTIWFFPRARLMLQRWRWEDDRPL